jgi:hypothetical protein
VVQLSAAHSFAFFSCGMFTQSTNSDVQRLTSPCPVCRQHCHAPGLQVQRSGHDAMWRTAAEHHTLLVPDVAAAPAAAAATRQPVASPADAASAAAATVSPATAATGSLAGMAQLLQRLLGMDLALRLRDWRPAVAAAAASAWRLGSTYGALLLLPALVTWLAASGPRAALEPAAAAARPRRWRSMRAVTGAYAAPQWGEFAVQGLQRLQQAAQWAAFIFVALHWLWEDAHGLPNVSPSGGGGGGTGVCPSEAATLGDALGLARRWAGHMFTGVAGTGCGLRSHPTLQALHIDKSCSAVQVWDRMEGTSLLYCQSATTCRLHLQAAIQMCSQERWQAPGSCCSHGLVSISLHCCTAGVLLCQSTWLKLQQQQQQRNLRLPGC